MARTAKQEVILCAYDDNIATDRVLWKNEEGKSRITWLCKEDHEQFVQFSDAPTRGRKAKSA
jgi:hypothetical protein